MRFELGSDHSHIFWPVSAFNAIMLFRFGNWNLLAPPVVSDEGVQHVVASHKFTFTDGSGSITTSDKEAAEPTDIPGLYTLNANMNIVSGTGIYEGVTGRLTAHGTIDFIIYQAEFEIAGVISAVE